MPKKSALPSTRVKKGMRQTKYSHGGSVSITMTFPCGKCLIGHPTALQKKVNLHCRVCPTCKNHTFDNADTKKLCRSEKQFIQEHNEKKLKKKK